MSDNDYQNKLKGFKAKIKTEPVAVPLQQVQPLAEVQQEEIKAQLNVWVPKTLKKAMKQHEVNSDESLTEITIKALQMYLSAK